MEAKILFARRALELARARREKCAAGLEYRLLCVHELNTMRAVAQDEHSEAVTWHEDVEYHQSHIHELDAIHATIQKEYQEALALLKSASFEVGQSEEAFVSMGEQIPPAFS